MSDGKVVNLFGSGVQAAAHPPVNRDLFGSVQEVRRKVIFLDEADWHEVSLLRVMARNPVAAVVDMRSRPVFRPPNYRHRHVISYFHRHGIQYLELVNLVRDGSAREKKMHQELAGVIFGRADYGLTICLYDTATKERGWLDSMRVLMKSGANQFMELHPRALGGSDFRDRSGR